MFDNLSEELETYMQRDPAASSYLEIFFTSSGLHAIWFYRLAHRLYNWHLPIIARLLCLFARWVTGIEIHPAAKIGKRLFIDHGMGVVIGATAEIADDCSIYQGVTLGGITQKFQGKRHPSLQDGVIIGAGAMVLGPITIGAYSKIGSNAVVLKDVQPDTTVVGIPAREISEKEQSHNFSAYGICKQPSCEENIDLALTNLQDKIDKLENKIEKLENNKKRKAS